MLTAIELENFLHQFETLRQVRVEEKSKHVIAPWLVVLSGVITIHGEHHAFEADLDLREFGGPGDLLKLVDQLLKSFAAAATHKGTP